MNIRRPLLVAWIALSIGSAIAAQDEAQPPPPNPFEFDAPADAAPKPAAAKKPAEPEVIETDPHVLAIRDLNPQTPIDLMTAVQNLINLGRPDEAKRYLAKLNALNLHNAALWSIQQEFGSGFLIRLSLDEAMQPEGRAFADRVSQGALTYVRHPARLDALIRQLSDPDPNVRRNAFLDLRYGAEDAAIALLQVWADPQRESEYGVVRQALKLLGRVAEGPLLGALESSNDSLRMRALAVLAELKSPQALSFLLRPAIGGTTSQTLQRLAAEAVRELRGEIPSRGEVEQLLYAEAMAYFRGKLTSKPDHQDMVAQWRWDDRQQRPILQRLPPRHASVRHAANLSRELVDLAPANREYQKLALTSNLESARLSVPWQTPLSEGAPQVLAAAANTGSATVLESVLEFALETEHFAAAVGALEAIGATGDTRFIDSTSGQPTTAVRALRHEDRRVRFAALQAIRHIDPREPFAGASFVPEAIANFGRASGDRKALIGHPRVELAQTLAGMLIELGLQTDKAAVGSDVFRLAASASDYEFILLSDAMDQPATRELLEQLRREPRTANIPIAILARQEYFERLGRMVHEDRLTIVVPFPADVQGVSYLIGRLVERAGDNWISPEEKLHQAIESLDYMAELAAKPKLYGFYDLVSQQEAVQAAAGQRSLAPHAIRVLGLLATPEAQTTLVSIASQNERPLAERQAAVAAFDTAIKTRGILLTKDQILEQYDRYNASQSLERETQNVLGAVLDTIEGPAVPVSQP